MNLQSLPKTSQLLTVVANIIFLCYLVLFVSADPSPALIAAGGFELMFFVSLLSYRRWRSKANSTHQADEALQSIEENFKPLYVARRLLAAITIAIVGSVCLYASVDLTALVLARSGKSNLAKPIYIAIAPPSSPNVHPGFSLELLAGAYIDAGRLAQAEPLLSDLLEIRTRVAGADSELTAAMYANLGDFYRKWGHQGEAESYYQRSITLSKALNLPQGYGSPMTKLGSLLCAEHRFAESQQCFTDALAVRVRIFGNHSAKVSETLQENATLLEAENHPDQARAMRQRADAINLAQRPSAQSALLDAAPLMVLALSLLFFSQRNRLLTAAADWTSRGRPAKSA
ncbi:MAG TPA: tetratricopeptide repeat protein [Trichormus sp.]